MEESKMSMKKLLTTISAGFALGLGLIALPYSAVTASAATSPRLQLRQNSYVYSISGKRKGKIVLKRGTYLRALSKKAIKGKKYYRIGKGRYIRTNNAVIVPEEDKDPVLFSVYLKYDAELYTKPNGDNSLYTLIGKKNVYETYTDSDGHIWYRLKYHNWVKASDTQKSKPKEDEDIPTSDNWDDSSDNTSIEEEENKDNPFPSGTSLDKTAIEDTGKYFESLVNEWRTQQGISTKITYTTKYYDYNVSRGIQVAQHFDKYNELSHDGSKPGGELICIVSYGTPQKMAQDAFRKFVYEDAKAGNAHRDHLKKPNLENFGIGLGVSHYNGYNSNAICFVVSTSN